MARSGNEASSGLQLVSSNRSFGINYTHPMHLFSQHPENILPYDGIAEYYGKIMSLQQAQDYFSRLMQNIAWKNDEAVIFGRHITTKRKAAWYGDRPFRYTYSKTTKQALPWTKELLELKQLTEEQAGASFNSCLLNLYHEGQEGMAWHSDDEKELEKDASIASLSFGAERKFAFKHKITNESFSLLLENGSLLVMRGTTQAHWMHAIPKSLKIITPRINLTFRTMQVV